MFVFEVVVGGIVNVFVFFFGVRIFMVCLELLEKFMRVLWVNCNDENSWLFVDVFRDIDSNKEIKVCSDIIFFFMML